MYQYNKLVGQKSVLSVNTLSSGSPEAHTHDRVGSMMMPFLIVDVHVGVPTST